MVSGSGVVQSFCQIIRRGRDQTRTRSESISIMQYNYGLRKSYRRVAPLNHSKIIKTKKTFNQAQSDLLGKITPHYSSTCDFRDY